MFILSGSVKNAVKDQNSITIIGLEWGDEIEQLAISRSGGDNERKCSSTQ